MAKFRRSKTRDELNEREARGLWLAIAQSRRLAKGNSKITLEVILGLHKTLLGSVSPEGAGRFRIDGEDVKELECVVPPPGGRAVQEMMYTFWRDFDFRIAKIPPKSPEDEEAELAWLESIFALAAWTQHKVTAIHPFCEGNGRMARILTNLLLMRFGLQPSRLKYEGENKDAYLHALCEVDRNEDYRHLQRIILEGSFETLQKEIKERDTVARRPRRTK